MKDEVIDAQFTNDYVCLVFKNKSRLDILGVKNSSRGARRHSGLLEEAILIDGKLLSEVIIPTMNIDRQMACGGLDSNEPHKSQVFVTTAGYKNTFAYQKMIQHLIWMVTKENAFVFGGDWKIPLLHGLFTKDLIEDLKEDGQYDPIAFSREYESRWSGATEDAFFNGDSFDKHRIVENAEFEPDKKSRSNSKISYIVATDVARMPGKKNAATVAGVLKLITKNNVTTKHLVNMFVLQGEHFETQSIKLKKIVFDFNAEQLIIDGNGLGVGLIDYLVKTNIDEETGDVYPPLSVTNDEEGKYAMFRTNESLPLLFILKTSTTSSEIHVNCLSQINSGKVKFLTDKFTAKTKYLAQDESLSNDSIEFNRLLLPHMLTDILKDELLNLSKKTEGKNIILDRVNKSIQKDKFSMLEYGLWWCKIQEDKRLRNNNDVDSLEFLMIKTPGSKNSNSSYKEHKWWGE